LHPRKIEAQISALQSCPERTVAVCSTVYFQDGSSPKEGGWAKGVDQIPWLTSEDPVQWLINLWTPGTGWGMVQTGAWLVPRPVAEEAGSWDERITRDQDGEYFTRVVLSGDAVHYVSNGCVYYRQYAETARRVSKRVTKSGFEGWLRAIDSKRDHVMPQVSKEDHDRAARGLARQYWSLALSAYPTYPEIAETAESRAAGLGFPQCLRSVSQNGWKGGVARTLTTTLGWRAARWCQTQYHRVREMLS
jgi:hypothetical protein